MKHPDEYFIISNGKDIYRLCPTLPVPPGFKIVTVLDDGMPVYQESGRLDLRLISIKRYHSEFYDTILWDKDGNVVGYK